MIIVTGTKRSGTSMWMRVLQAAGLPLIGDAFPGKWGETIRDANPGGFYESLLRRGIYFATNPHPRTGAYLFPDDTRGYAVKVFIPGLIRSDRAYIDKVIATMRPWREYVTSLERLYDMEHEAREKLAGKSLPKPPRLPSALEWWAENYSLLSDLLTRRYPVHMVAYDSVLARPHEIIPEAIGWLGIGDPEAAAKVVDEKSRTQEARPDELPDPSIEPRDAAVFDAYYERVRDRQPIDVELIDELNAANERLAPRIAEALAKVRTEVAKRRAEHFARQAKQREAGEAPDGAGAAPTRDAALEGTEDLIDEGL